ncbi:MAG: MATE family efflux transporter, partial [bacterium]
MPLLSSVDTAILGHQDEIYYLGALAVGGIIFNFLYWGFGFLRMGTTGLTAQAYGTKNDREVFHILVRTLLIATVGGLLLIFSQSFIARISFVLIDATPQVERYAREYFHIRIYAAPATLALYAIHGWFLGVQNARYPLILTIFVNALNIILNVSFVFGMGMKADGVALGTVLAQYSGLILGVILYLNKYSFYSSKIDRDLLFEKTALKRIFVVNSDIFIRT